MTHHDTPRTLPGNDDPAIGAATDEVVETWSQSAPGKDPNAEAADFERMREGFGELARGGTTDDAQG